MDSRGPRSAFATLALLVGAIPVGAQAQSQTPLVRLDRFSPASDSRGIGPLEGAPDGRGQSFGLFVDHAVRPLTVFNGEMARTDVVEGQTTVHVVSDVSVVDGLRIVSVLPITAIVYGTTDAATGLAPGSGGLGDSMFGVRARLWRPVPGFTLSASLWITVPTTHGGPWVGSNLFAGEGRGVLSWNVSRFTVLANLGVRVRTDASFANVNVGPEVLGGVGARWWISRAWWLEANLVGSTGIEANTFFRRAETYAEADADVAFRVADTWTFLLGGGGGLAHGYGTPEVRFLAGLRVDVGDAGDRLAPPGALGREPALVVARPASVASSRPPPADLDTDGDGIPDVVDQCITLPEDHDGVLDEDGCPDEDPPVVASVDPSVLRRIAALLGLVHFETDRAVVSRDGAEILRTVAETLMLHPEITQITVFGHADARGSGEHNAWLSQRRADAVARWLVNLGVDPVRLASVPEGSNLPAATNETPLGRAVNRRVELHVHGESP